MTGENELPPEPRQRTRSQPLQRWSLRRGCWAGLAIAIGGIGLLIAIGQGLSYDDGQPTAPVVIVLGDMSEVYQFAADAHREQAARVGVATYAPKRGQRIGAVPGDAETARRDLATRGVQPASVFDIATEAHTSHDLLRGIERWRADQNVEVITLACGNLGSRYWQFVRDQTLDADQQTRYRIVSVPTPPLTPTRWFRSRYGGKLVLGAVLRLVFVAVHGESDWVDRDVYEHLLDSEPERLPAAA